MQEGSPKTDYPLARGEDVGFLKGRWLPAVSDTLAALRLFTGPLRATGPPVLESAGPGGRYLPVGLPRRGRNGRSHCHRTVLQLLLFCIAH